MRSLGDELFSFIVALRAARRYGRADKLWRAQRLHQALEIAREGLTLLGRSGVRRSGPAAGSVLLNLTILVEHLAAQLKQPGANESDLRDALAFCRLIQPGERDTVDTNAVQWAEWTSYLEARLQAGPRERSS